MTGSWRATNRWQKWAGWIGWSWLVLTAGLDAIPFRGSIVNLLVFAFGVLGLLVAPLLLIWRYWQLLSRVSSLLVLLVLMLTLGIPVGQSNFAGLVASFVTVAQLTVGILAIGALLALLWHIEIGPTVLGGTIFLVAWNLVFMTIRAGSGQELLLQMVAMVGNDSGAVQPGPFSVVIQCLALPALILSTISIVWHAGRVVYHEVGLSEPSVVSFVEAGPLGDVQKKV